MQILSIMRIGDLRRVARYIFRERFPGTIGISTPRGVHTTAVTFIKQVVEREEDGFTVIESVIVDSPHKEHLLVPEVTVSIDSLTRLPT